LTLTHPIPPASAPGQRVAARTATTALALAALACLAGCLRPERLEAPIDLRVDTVPPGAAVTLSVKGQDARALGKGPATVSGLKLVRKEFVSGEVRYWLEDLERKLPIDPLRPQFTSAPYAAGQDYPLELTATAKGQDGREARSMLVIDRALLEQLWAAPSRALSIRVAFAGTR
jgi:hypothetical protein